MRRRGVVGLILDNHLTMYSYSTILDVSISNGFHCPDTRKKIMIVNTAKVEVLPVAIPSFDGFARDIVAAQKKIKTADKVLIKVSEAIVQAIQKHLDACASQSVPRDNRGVTALGKSIRECQVFIDRVAQGLFEKKTVTEYAQGAMRAYFHNVPFGPTLKNDPAYKIPGKDRKVKSSGSVKTTDNEAAFKTARKLLEQLRLLNRDECAVDVLDAMLSGFDGFTENEDAII